MKEFIWPVRVYIEDTDAGGIVYYVNYLKFMERARTEYLRALGYDKNFIFNLDMMFVVASAHVDYLAPAMLDDELTVVTTPIKVARSYIEMQQDVYRNDTLLCRGHLKIACVDRTMKPKGMPQNMRQTFADL
jgi:4-hydroxybenzoyl-CoA thioesterase